MQASRMMTREEHETVVSDGDVLTRVLESVGLHVWFRYQKFREEFAAEDATIALDETPIGTFVEIEGGERAIESMARALGRKESDYVLDSYRGLFLQRRERLGLTGADMMFADEWSQHSS
jgi:adenylate cyclase class 2